MDLLRYIHQDGIVKWVLKDTYTLISLFRFFLCDDCETS